MASPSLSEITTVKAFLHTAFTIKDLVEAHFFLGLEIARSSQGIYINQRKYALDLLQDARLIGCKSASTPIVKNQNFVSSIETILPNQLHLSLLLLFLRHFVMLIGRHVKILDVPLQVIVSFLGNYLISWKTKKQVIVSRSSAEAEYHSLSSIVCELLWIDYLLSDLHHQSYKPIPMWCDNQEALHIMKNSVFHERTKHLDINCQLPFGS